MVALVKNSDRLNQPATDARFVRRTPSQTRFENQKPSLRYKRARIYSAQLGRFISRDPIGFVDGMSLYRGYFVPNHIDPFGRMMRIQDNPAVDRRGTIPDWIIENAKKKNRTLCGNLSFTCSNGKTYSWPVYGDSDRAADVLGVRWKNASGCVTFVGPKRIECTGSCDEIKDWKATKPQLSHEERERVCRKKCKKYDGGYPNPTPDFRPWPQHAPCMQKCRDSYDIGTHPKGLPVLDHEACHACAYEQCGFWVYGKTAVWDNCDDYGRPSVPQW